MKLVILFGPHAVGKMTVGQELARLTGLKLFHNHMTIEPVCGLFDTNHMEQSRLTALFRREIFESFVKTDAYGLIFTYMWAFDSPSDWNYIRWLEQLYKPAGPFYLVELEAEKAVRWERNKTENRLLHKPSKRDISHSEHLFTVLEERYRLNSLPGELTGDNYMRINNTNLSPVSTAQLIKEKFLL